MGVGVGMVDGCYCQNWGLTGWKLLSVERGCLLERDLWGGGCNRDFCQGFCR